MRPDIKYQSWFKADARRYRFIVWSVMALGYMVVFFHRLAPGVVRDDLATAFGMSGVAFGHLASMYFYSYLAMQIPVGMLADSLGSRITTSAGIFLSGAGSMIFGLAPSLGWAYLGRFIVGVGVSTVFTCALKMLSEWYSEREFATMSGITTLVGNFGGLAAQTPLAIMVGLFTWRKAFIAIGIFSFFLSIVCLLLARDRPSDMGFTPINPSDEEQEVKSLELIHALKGALCSKGIWPATIIVGLFLGGQLAFTGAWGVPWLTDVYGLSRKEASRIVSLVVIGAMIGSILAGKLSDMAGARRWPLVMMASFYSAAWGVILFWGSGKPPLEILKPALFVMGVASFAVIICIAVAKEVNNPRYTGIAVSVLNMGAFIGVAAYPPAMGMMIDILQGHSPVIQYRGALTLCLVGAVVGLLLAFGVPETHCRNITVPRAAKGE